MRPLVIATVVVAWAIGAAQAQEAPLGFSWGSTVADITSMGLPVIDQSEQGGFQLLTLSSAPIEPDDTDFIILAVHSTFGLQKISWVSTDFEGDAFGTAGIAYYFNLKGLLTEKYGTPSDVLEQTGITGVYGDRDEFYQCLEYSGCGAYWSIWSTGNFLISLRIRGISRGNGYISLQYEGPQFGAALEADEAAAADRARRAF